MQKLRNYDLKISITKAETKIPDDYKKGVIKSLII